MYTGIEDLLMKAEYYLAHEEERKCIAQKGYEKLSREHDLSKMVGQMLKKLTNSSETEL